MQEDTSVWERDMYKRKIEKDIRCPLEYGLEIFGGKWNSQDHLCTGCYEDPALQRLQQGDGDITDADSGISIKKS